MLSASRSCNGGAILRRLKHYADHFLLMFEYDRLAAFVDGFVTNKRDLTDEMYANSALHEE